jgi:hypothetical protein
MKHLLTDEIVPLGDCLNRNVTWRKTKGPTALWRAEVGPQSWSLRVNDFPEENLYTLLINDQEIGHFDDWPPPWVRSAQELDSIA